MKIAHFISNLVFSIISLLYLCVIYTDNFGADWLPKALHPILDKIIGKVFSEDNIPGLMFLYAICLVFIVLTIILFIKSLIKKQNVIPSVLSLICIILMIIFGVLAVYSEPNRILCIFTAVVIAVQLIVSLIDTVKSYSIEYSE